VKALFINKKKRKEMTDEHLSSTDLNVATGGEDAESVISSKGSKMKIIF
jgi:hypothetical protein